MPLNFGFSLANVSASLVIRTKQVELLAMQGARVVSRVRVPIAGNEVQHLIQAIRQATAMAGVNTTKFAVAVPTADVLVRFFVMPVLPKAERDTAIQFEARKYNPFKTEALVWDYHAVELRGSNKLEVIFAAIQRSLFQPIQAALVEAGIQPTKIEPRSLGLARLTASRKWRGGGANEFVCLVDVEQDQAHLVIAKRGYPYLTRDVALGNLQEAEGEAQTGERLAEHLVQRLYSELRVSIDFFTREYPSAVVHKVILVGDDGMVAPLSQRLSAQLGCPVELGTELLMVGSKKAEGELPLSFAAALGVLLGEKERPGVGLDFLRRSVVKAGSQQAKKSQLVISNILEQLKSAQAIGLISAAVGLVGVVWFLGSQQIAEEERQLSRVLQTKPEVEWGGLQNKDQEALTPIKEQAAGQLELLSNIVDQRVGVVKKLDGLARALSDGMWLTDLQFEERPDQAGKSQVALRVSGACYLNQPGKELTAIQEFENRIKNSPSLFNGFTVARVERIREAVRDKNQRQYTYRTFQLNCRSDQRL